MSDIIGYLAIAFFIGCFAGSAIYAVVSQFIKSSQRQDDIDFGLEKRNWPLN